MPVCQRLAYYDHAAVGPLPAASASAMCLYAQQASQLGDVPWLEWNVQVEQLRDGLAELLNAERGEIALVANTTTAIGLIAEGWRWKAGESVVVPANEFPSNLVPWRQLARRGVEVREVPVGPSGTLDLQAILDAIDSSTRIVAVSWVGFASGHRIDVAQFCSAVHQRGAYVFLDAIQGLGAFPIDVRSCEVDFLAADGHKWMLGPEGAGVLFIRDSHLERIDPLMVGWRSLREGAGFDPASTAFKATAARWEGGSANMGGLHALKCSVDMLLRYGSHRSDSPVARAISDNVDYLQDELKRAGFDVLLPAEATQRSGILGVQWPGADLVAARKFCLSQGIVTSVRAGRLRVSTHAYNNTDDARSLVAALKHFMHGQHG